MAISKRASSQALVLGALLLAGCAEGGDNILTGSLAGTNAKADPACVTLASRIETLRKEGIPDKIEKAAARRYKLTKSDLSKADQLTKTNAELQARCSSVPPRTDTADATPPPAADKKTKTSAARKSAPKASASAPAPAPAKTEQ
jgi:hypothetical protein